MDKIKEYLKSFISSHNISYYIALGISVIALIGGIMSSASLSFAGATALPLVFTLLGLLIFIGLSTIKCERIGAAVSGVFVFGALVSLITSVYDYFIQAVQDQAMTKVNIMAIKGMSMFVVCLCCLIICSIALNVFTWLRLRKKDDKAVTLNV